MRAAAILSLAWLLMAPRRACAFIGDIHVDMTEQALREAGYDRAASSDVVAGNLATDDDEYSIPAAHFDCERFAAGSARLRAKLKAALTALKGCDPVAARRQVGRALHAVQDFFAHSNWVETHAPAAPIDLLHLADPAPDVRCDPVTHQGALTSGYFPDDRRPRPAKCVHAELNKDEPDRPFFAAAHDRALAETRTFLAIIDREIDGRFAPSEAAYRKRLLKSGAAGPAYRRRCKRPTSAELLFDEAPVPPRSLETAP